MFTVCALFFGDYTALACRCISSITKALRNCNLPVELRVTLNACVPATIETVTGAIQAWGGPAVIYKSEVNRFKYPIMRKMLYDPVRLLASPYVMWFDDDSYLNDPPADWWDRLNGVMEKADIVGGLYKMPFQGQQAEAIKHQPWFKGKPVTNGSRFLFITGGWWCGRYAILKQWDYPWLALKHNGGDSMLGELCRQQDYRLRQFNQCVKINADMGGNTCKAPRRGISQRALWANWDPNPDLSHHNFELDIIYEKH